MKQFVLILSFFLVLFASCERTEIEHGFADKVESVFFNPDTASSQLVSCVMKNGDSLSFYGEKDSIGMPLSITHMLYYSNEKQLGALMTFDDDLPSQVLSDDGSSISFEWITRRMANVQVSDLNNHIVISGILDLDSVYTEDPHFWDSIVPNNTGDSRTKSKLAMSKKVRTNEKVSDSKDASLGQLVHVDFTRCGEVADVDSYLKVYDGYSLRLIDVVRPTKVGDGYDYYIKPHLPTEYWVNRETPIQIARALDAFFSQHNGAEEGLVGSLTAFLSTKFPKIAPYITGPVLLQAMLAYLHDMAGSHCLEDLAHNIGQFWYESPNCYVQIFAEGEKSSMYSLTYSEQYYQYIIDLPDDPQITDIIFSPRHYEIDVSCIPSGSIIRVCEHYSERPFRFYDEYVIPFQFTGTIQFGDMFDDSAYYLGVWFVIMLPDGKVLRVAAGA